MVTRHPICPRRRGAVALVCGHRLLTGWPGARPPSSRAFGLQRTGLLDGLEHGLWYSSCWANVVPRSFARRTFLALWLLGSLMFANDDTRRLRGKRGSGLHLLLAPSRADRSLAVSL
jgi:hypothetical protein